MELTLEQQQDIETVRSDLKTTRREVAPELEKILYQPIPVLDHGFVRVIDYMGNDAAIVQAARVSYGRGTKKVNEDAGLINYLLRHRHTTPFEMCEIKFHVKLPIFIARQWIRHRTANVNEYSGRYSVMDKEFYIPARDQLAAQSTANRQGRDRLLSDEESARVLHLLRADAEQVYMHYEEMLNADENDRPVDETRDGLARELARMNLTLNYYTQWYWKVDLHNLMHFLALRADAHAQYEIRVYAEAMLGVLQKWLPITYDAFLNYRVGAAELSAKGLSVVKRMLGGEAVTQEQSSMSKGEWRELMGVLGRET
jgi:thymidylate synthase (FAD)